MLLYQTMLGLHPRVPRLMTISADVRLLILESLLIDSDIIRQEEDSPRNIAYGNWSRASTFSDLINISLTCKTLYREAREAFYTYNTLYLRKCRRRGIA
ncbi:hypothetical protein HYALB_00011126 [Hymenoscyphus albidus]|uniref:F-box domain-containing protein n=1 Tax=Hymenoscyphus albidus TaxID=595503 RepID=A0A9N9LQT2_9HELO|nr:hypothetical protein HYALB_00011126 [Hymenoscyphus albidus]